MEKRRLNIILRVKDQEHVVIIQRDTGETTVVGAIRAALRKMAREIPANVNLGSDEIGAWELERKVTEEKQ